MSACLNIAGLLISLVGVLVLFQYGMPKGVRTGGADLIVARPTDESRKRERLHFFYSCAGLSAIVLGTVLQVLANWPIA